MQREPRLQAKGKSDFKLQKASVGGGAVLKPKPAHWQQLEEQHVCNRVLVKKGEVVKMINGERLLKAAPESPAP